MKKLFFIIIAFFFMLSINAQEFEGLEQGDKEISFNGFIIASEGITMGNVFFSFGTYITEKLLVGAAPTLTIGSGVTDFGAQVFGTYNFTNGKPAFPYVKAQYYQYSFTSGDFASNGFLQAGAGYKTFFSDKLAWDTSATFGMNLGFDYGLFMIMTGLTFVW